DATLAVPEERQNEARYHDTVRVDAADVHPPAGVTPFLIEGRNRVPVTLHRLVERRLPVRVDAPDDRMAAVVVDPPTVLVRAPREPRAPLRPAPPRRSALPSRPEATAAETVVLGPVPVADEVEGKPVRAVPDAVTVRLTLQPKRKPYEVEVPITFLC